ncbi:Septal ring factor [Candidatus Ornithobacterium hominis]|uniref:M23 family metallopeptidase n=1 Tax=Candidatus Ornithobacterium hominis TaxID=2497989 RepID=UPI0024BC42A6|nr:M23 family metallopeptidase [Candidatus Ornithobacterium hominis]CAI9428844.1 Septal ring factor [Candidatus Ornithobacterium hominis]
MEKRNQKRLDKKMLSHYQLQLLDDEDKRSVFLIKLTPLNSLLFFTFFMILITTLIFLGLKYSPLKEYFISPTIENQAAYKNQLLKLNERILELENNLEANELYIKSIQAVVSGNIKAEKVDSLVVNKFHLNPDSELFKPSEEDSLFRIQIEKEEMEAMKASKNTVPDAKYFTPVKGFVTGKFDLTEKHLAVDISAGEGDVIKSIADGDVLFSNWTPDAGYTLIIRHANDIISMYKHCAKVYKKQGDMVKKGEAIAQVGNTGELTTGPHLHFELWVQGKAVDPEEYIDF